MFAPLAALASLALALVGDNKYRTYFSRAVNDDPPTVVLDSATLIGFTDDAVTSFTGIPFAEAPVGNLRLRHPVPIKAYNGTLNATQPATQCRQLAIATRDDLPPQVSTALFGYFGDMSFGDMSPEDEDCLTVNVQIPEGTKAGDKLPVLALIYGGGFTMGSTSQYPADAIVRRSAELNEPVIVVAMNYRLNVFGFLGGKEIKDAGVGNLGLHDQRAALRWINNYVSAFGGDPEKVTLWGPSAGAISIATQMIANGGDPEGLFRGAIMHSGSPLPTGGDEKQQEYYDAIVEAVGCTGTQDTLQCLREAPADALVASAQVLPGILGYMGLASVIPWSPQEDGTFLKAPPQELVLKGEVAPVPFISGDCLDEDEFRAFVHDFYFPHASRDDLMPLFNEVYTDDPAQGSPFGTGTQDKLAPQYKRMAALQGDVTFQAPRRFFLEQCADKQPVWSFVSERGGFPGLGYPHGSDFFPALVEVNEVSDYIIHFATTLDPNGGSNRTVEWPKYDKVGRKVLRILDGDVLDIGDDCARKNMTDAVTKLGLEFPL